VLQDEIRRRTDAEAAHEKSDETFRTLAFVTPAGIVLTDERGRYVFVNHQWTRIMGMTATTAEGDGWREALHPLDRARVEESWTQAVALGERYTEEYRVRRSTGETVRVVIHAAPVLGADGRVTGYVGMVEDVTARRETAVLLARRDEQMRLVVEALNDGVFDWDLDLNCMTWSPRLCELLAFDGSRQTPSPASLTELAHPDDRERLQRAITQHLAAGTPLRLDVRLARGGGGYGVFIVSACVARDDGGRPLRVCGAVTDITHVRALERELDQHRSGGQFSAPAHDRPRLALAAAPSAPR